jgi:rare lipoprotein A
MFEKKSRHAITLAAVVSAFAIGQTPVQAKDGCGGASWYALHSRTASGERMNPSKLTAAHRNLPFGAKVKVTNRNNGRAVIVRINDRGPFIRGRVLDLSRAAAHEIGMVRSGTAKICFEVIG